jgi:hypothetical protein
MPKYQFLSPDWTAEARRIRAEVGDGAGSGGGTIPAEPVRMNLVVTDVPFGGGTVDAHIDSGEGRLLVDLGHIDDPDVKVTLDYLTAKAIVVDGNTQAAAQAFMGGKITVEGDYMKLLAMQAAPLDPVAAELARRVREITD